MLCNGIHNLISFTDELLYGYSDVQCTLGCFRKKKTRFVQENLKYNPTSISLGVSLKGYKRIFDSDKV